MKVLFNNISISGNYTQYQRTKAQTNKNPESTEPVSVPVPASCAAVYFCAKPDSTMLLAQSDKLLCAYSRKQMLSPYIFRAICSKLAKKTNAQSAMNFLKQYREYMPEVETEIFDMFEEYGISGKKTFQDILIEKRPEALTGLRQKQTDVLHSTDNYILSFNEDLADELFFIRDTALLRVNDGTFSRSEILEQLNNIETGDLNKKKIREIYKKWYQLPRSYTDYDAFIVKYSKCSHNDIAQRLLSMAVASVEHIKPYANGGEDKLGNYALIRMLHNQDKGNMNLAEYDEFNPDIEIKKNLPKYIDDILGEIKRGNPYFSSHYNYPGELRQSIITETGWESLIPETAPLQQFKSSQIQGSKKGANRYRAHRK